MRIFLLLITILSYGNISWIALGDYDIEGNLYYTSDFSKRMLRGKRIGVKVNDLPKYEEKFELKLNLKFKNALRIWHVNYDDLNRNITNGYGIQFEHYKSNNEVSFTSAHHKKRYFSFKKKQLFFDIKLFNFGIMIYDHQYNANQLNDIKRTYEVDYGILLVLKVTSNRLSFRELHYNPKSIRVSVCPYINWVPKGGMIEYIPDPFVKDNGFFEESNDKTHIILPMFKRGNDEDFFTCGKVIQPTLPDLTIGCYLKDVKKGKPFDSNITALKNELVCNNGKYTNINKLYHFGFMERDSNYMNITKMDKIDASLTNHYKLFSEQIIMMYDKEKINTMVKSKNKFFKIKSKGISEVPLCIAGLNNDINAVLIPTTSSLDSVSYNENLDSYYSFVSEKDMGINMPLKCLSKVENDTYNRYDEFYSKAAVLSVIKSENITNSSSPIIDKTQFTNKIEGFGSYMCQVSNKTKAYREDFIKIKKMYFIPVDNLLVDFQDVVINNKTDSYVHCNKSYETWGNLNTMYIYSQEQSFMTMHVLKYPSENATIKDNIVYIKNKNYQKTLEVYCTYETIFNSVFLTKRNFKFPNLIVPIRKPEVTTSLHDENKMDGLKVIRICGVLFIVLILLCTILTIIIIKKNRKRKERNYLKSCSTLTKKSKSKSKIKNLFKSKSIINRSFSTSSNRPFLKNSKNKQKKI